MTIRSKDDHIILETHVFFQTSAKRNIEGTD